MKMNMRVCLANCRTRLTGCCIVGIALLTFAPQMRAACVTNVSTTAAISSPSAADKIHSANFAAQTFTVVGAGCFKLDSVTISILKSGSPANLVVRVYEVTVDLDSELTGAGSLLGTSDTVLASSIGTSLADVTIGFTSKPTLNGGSTYMIVVLQDSFGGSGGNYYQLGTGDGNPYGGGEYCKSGDSGLTWACPGNNQPSNNGSEDVRMSICLSPCLTASACTYTQGAYKNNLLNWPSNFTTLALGSTSYTQAQLLSIFEEPVSGNGLIQLAHQLITAKLNQQNGASVPASVASVIATADALIDGKVVPPVGSDSLPTSATSSLTCTLDTYNSGCISGGPQHCGGPATCPSCAP